MMTEEAAVIVAIEEDESASINSNVDGNVRDKNKKK